MRTNVDRGTPIELGRVERLVALRRFPGAAALGSDELVALADASEPLRFRKGAFLQRKNETVAALFVICDGDVRVAGHAGASAEGVENLRTVGVAHAFARDAAGLECRAESDVVALRLPIEDVEDVFEDHPSALVLCARELARRALDSGVESAAPPSRRAGDAATLLGGMERPLGFVERLMLLVSHPLVGVASVDGAALLAAQLAERRLSPGEQLWSAGDASGHVYVVQSGVLELRRPGRDARRVSAGELVGALECIADRPRVEDASAVGAVVVLGIDRDALFDAWEDHADLGMTALRGIGQALLSVEAA